MDSHNAVECRVLADVAFEKVEMKYATYSMSASGPGEYSS
jgi:hypothetical protein